MSHYRGLVNAISSLIEEILVKSLTKMEHVTLITVERHMQGSTRGRWRGWQARLTEREK